jgi:hypothetical protein
MTATTSIADETANQLKVDYKIDDVKLPKSNRTICIIHAR